MSFVPNPALEVAIKADPEFNHSMGEVGDEAFDYMVEHIPVASGRLRRSARIERLPGGGQRLSVNEDYWLFPEYGTENMGAQPYLRPTLTAMGLQVA